MEIRTVAVAIILIPAVLAVSRNAGQATHEMQNR